MKQQRAFQRNLIVSWAGVIVVLILWQLANTLRLVNPGVFPGPLQILDTALNRFPAADVLDHARISVQRVFFGFLIGGGLGMVTGILAGWYRPVSYTHLRAHETVLDLVCRLLLEKKN